MTDNDIAELREALAQISSGAAFPIRFTVATGCPVHAYYPKWLPPEELRELPTENTSCNDSST
jgi:hypothetical protein